jgi:hypothetical protein
MSGAPSQGSAMASALPGSPLLADAPVSRPGAGVENRRSARTNMFISAIAEISGRACPVRIRNMSETGALLESNVALPRGASVTLMRGEHGAFGAVVWSEGHKCGIAFAHSVCVASWMGRPGARDPDGQKQVDALQAQIRSGAVPLATAQPARTELLPQELQQRLSDELALIKRIIDDVGEELSAEAMILAEHGESMQQFDIISQSLGHLSRLLVAPDPAQAVNEIGMESRRRRLSGY